MVTTPIVPGGRAGGGGADKRKAVSGWMDALRGCYDPINSRTGLATVT